jgi:hypothetical protein
MPDLADYRLDVFNNSGVLQGSMTGTAAGGSAKKSGFLQLACINRVNAPGLLTFSLRGDHWLLSSLADKWQFELWRKPFAGSWSREMAAIFRAGQWEYGEKSNIVLYCPGILSLLGYRTINWYADLANRTAFDGVVAETIMKTLVTYNITSSATTGNGRKRSGTNWPATQITVEADGANGDIRDWYCFGDNLLASLQKLAPIAGGDFDLVKTSPTAYQFRWYDGQLGTDRSATVKFSLGLGNMGLPEYNESRLDEKTVACVWGQGEGSARDYVTRTGLNYTTTNDIEMFVDARDVELGNSTGLNDRGDQKLSEVEAARTFRFDALQAPATLYGVDYFLGDLVSVENPLTGSVYTQKVVAVSQSLDPAGKQSVGIEVGVA